MASGGTSGWDITGNEGVSCCDQQSSSSVQYTVQYSSFVTSQEQWYNLITARLLDLRVHPVSDVRCCLLCIHLHDAGRHCGAVHSCLPATPVPHHLTGSYLTGSSLSHRFVSHRFRTILQVRISPVPHHLTGSYPTCTAPSHRFVSHLYRTISQVRISPLPHHLTGSYPTCTAPSHRFVSHQFRNISQVRRSAVLQVRFWL